MKKILSFILISLFFSLSASAQWSKVGSAVAKGSRRTNITGPLAGATIYAVHRYQNDQHRLVQSHRVPSISVSPAVIRPVAIQSSGLKIVPTPIKAVELLRTDSLLKGRKPLVVVPDTITIVDVTHHE